ncbi:MAG TPA: GNAT family N-acetyltransferase [Pyrinomonadaceae bacterium]|nr:GNAT family N-acetyltransferase [Pyrinomonadaceae bacterium]
MQTTTIMAPYRTPHAAAPHELETARVLLRPFAEGDLDRLCLLTGDPEVMRFIGEGRPLAREETARNLLNIMASFWRRGFGRWALVHKQSGALAGYCGLSASNEEVGVELAYMLGREFWGRGLATEASRACLRYGFEGLGLEEIAALTMPGNIRSRRVLDGLGMRLVGHAHFYGYDCVHYRMPRHDFRHDGSPYVARPLAPPREP